MQLFNYKNDFLRLGWGTTSHVLKVVDKFAPLGWRTTSHVHKVLDNFSTREWDHFSLLMSLRCWTIL